MSGSRPLAYRKSEKGGRDRSKVVLVFCVGVVGEGRREGRLTGTGTLLHEVDEADTSAFIFG